MCDTKVVAIRESVCRLLEARAIYEFREPNTIVDVTLYQYACYHYWYLNIDDFRYADNWLINLGEEQRIEIEVKTLTSEVAIREESRKHEISEREATEKMIAEWLLTEYEEVI